MKEMLKKIRIRLIIIEAEKRPKFQKRAVFPFSVFSLLLSENASLILACAFPELVCLRMIIYRKTPHSCKDTKMATSLDFCRGMSRLVSGTV